MAEAAGVDGGPSSPDLGSGPPRPAPGAAIPSPAPAARTGSARRLRAATRSTLLVGAYLAAVLSAIAWEAPAALRARSGLFPPIATVAGVPVAVEGIYLFTFGALLAAAGVARARGAGWAELPVLAGIGLAGYEAAYAVGFALLTLRPGLLVEAPDAQLTGWSAYSAWMLLEGAVASVGVYRWRAAAIDRLSLLALAAFVLGLLAWWGAFDLAYPPFDDAPGVFAVNALTEIAGSLFLPLVLTGRSVASGAVGGMRPRASAATST